MEKAAMQCYLNGKFMPLQQARISPLDRGFLFGDGVYEVIPVYARRPFYWRRHLARLSASLQHIRLPFAAAALRALAAPARQLIAAAAVEEQALYIHISRGAQNKRGLPIPQSCTPTVFMAAWEKPPPPAALLRGVSCTTAEDIRWQRCDIKSTSLLAAALLSPAAEAEEEEVIIIRDGNVCEGSRGNFMLVKGGALHTPPADHRILNGITRQVVCDIAQTLGLAVHERAISADEITALSAAEEVWLLSSVREMLPVIRINGAPVGGGKPGAVFKRVHTAWRAHIASPTAWQKK